MIIVMKSTASKEDVEKVSGSVEKLGLRVNVVNGATQSVIGIIGDTTKVDPESIEVNPPSKSRTFPKPVLHTASMLEYRYMTVFLLREIYTYDINL